MTLEELRQELEQLESEGYVQHMDPMDYQVVSENPCETCGGEMYGRGRAKFGANSRFISYRAFACCEKCDRAEEF